MTDLLMRKFRFLVAPTRFYPENLEEDIHNAYLCWKSVWGQALCEEMNVKDILYSDNFTRQSHVAILFYENEPYALVTLNLMNLENILYQDDSYFKVWPKSASEELRSHSKVIMTCGNLALNFKFRKNGLGISGKDLMFSMVVQYLKSTNLDSIIAAVRLEKGMEKAAYRTGAYSIDRDLPYTIPGQRVDLVCWKRDLDVNLLNPDIKNISEYVWKKSSVIVERYFLKGEKNAA